VHLRKEGITQKLLKIGQKEGINEEKIFLVLSEPKKVLRELMK